MVSDFSEPTRSLNQSDSQCNNLGVSFSARSTFDLVQLRHCVAALMLRFYICQMVTGKPNDYIFRDH